jgi:hypothetical protein
LAWQLGTIKASNLQPYLSAVNNIYKGHGRDPVAQGDIVARVRKGLASSLLSISLPLIRVLVPAKVVLLALVRVEAVRLDIQQLDTTDIPRTKIELQRAFVATTVLFLFFSRSGAGI